MEAHRIIEGTDKIIVNGGVDLAGIVCLQNERFNYVFGITRKGDADYLLL